MANTRISDLTAASAVAGSDLFEVSQGSGPLTSRKATGTQVQSFVLGSYAGATSLTILGTVTTGTWAATPVALAYGGTGATSASAARTNLGLAIGANVQAWSVNLDGFAAKTVPTGAIVGTSDAQTLTNKTLTGYIETVFAITDGAAFEIDPGNGTIQTITLGASRTPKATNFAAGESVTLMVGDGAAYTITWTDATFGTGGVVWVGGLAPTLATTGFTVIELWKVGSQVYGTWVGNVA